MSQTEKTSRRRFLRMLAGGAAGLPLSRLVQGQGRGPQSPPPNFLYIVTDDQRWDAMSCAGHPFLQTPNLDRIRNEGVLFANAFVTTSLCSPSRACFLTGTYAHTHGVVGNDDENRDFDPAVTPSFPQLLRDQAGYQTAFIGKWHMNSKTNAPRPGFDYWLSFKGQGVYTDPTLNENGTEFTATGYITDLLTDYCVNWLDAHGGSPFCLVLAHKAVHGPFTPADRHASAYPTETHAEPASYDDSLESKPQWQRFVADSSLTRYRSRDFRTYPSPVVPASFAPRDFTLSDNERDYLRTLLAVDDSVGRVLQKLQDLGQLDNTVIAFAGDNGYFWGEHRRGDKRLMYEEALRIPFLMRYPPAIAPNSTISKMALNIDLAPTFLDLAGVPVPAGMQGRSMRQLFEGNDAGWRSRFLYEYWVDLNPVNPRMVGVRTEAWKYVRYPDLADIDEMYDLAGDPYELANLAVNPSYADRAGELRAELDELLLETNYRNVLWEYPPFAQTPMVSLDFANVSGTTAPDGSGNGNNGTIYGASAVIDPSFGTVLQFAGAERVDVATSATFRGHGTPLSVEMVVKVAGDGALLAHGGQTRGYGFFVENGVPSFLMRELDTTVIVDGRDSCAGTWTHLAGVYDKRQIRLYVNGSLADTIVPKFNKIAQAISEKLQIGLDGGTQLDDPLTMNGFSGLIRFVCVWGRVLTDEEIRQRSDSWIASGVPDWRQY